MHFDKTRSRKGTKFKEGVKKGSSARAAGGELALL